MQKRKLGNSNLEVSAIGLGSWGGAMAQDLPDDTLNSEDNLTAEILGKRVATIAAKMKG